MTGPEIIVCALCSFMGGGSFYLFLSLVERQIQRGFVARQREFTEKTREQNRSGWRVVK